MTKSQIMSLQDKIDTSTDLWSMLYNAQEHRFQFPVKPEFSNWVDEQIAWRSSVVFQNMSHHMTDVFLEGPDVVHLLSDFGINSFSGFGAMQAKQYVACNTDGYIIGDAVLFCEEENRVSLVGKPSAANWLRYQIETGDYDVKVTKIDLPSATLTDRVRFRYQVQGPNADQLLQDLNGGPMPDISFFKMGKFNIGPHEVVALNHRMSGAPGYEFWGPSEVGSDVQALILEAGAKYGLTQIGGRTYPVTAAVSGWVGSLLPAIYTDEAMQAYREWLPATGFEARHSIGGSLANGKVEDFYRTPYDMGYGFIMKFDHDFLGRAALEAMPAKKRLKKVRLVWNANDVVDIYASAFRFGDKYKKIELPVGGYAVAPSDRVQHADKDIGVSFYPAYSEADRCFISLACIPAELALEGQQLTVIWGEPDGGSNKPTVERHIQKAVRVTVDPKPIKRG